MRDPLQINNQYKEFASADEFLHAHKKSDTSAEKKSRLLKLTKAASFLKALALTAAVGVTVIAGSRIIVKPEPAPQPPVLNLTITPQVDEVAADTAAVSYTTADFSAGTDSITYQLTRQTDLIDSGTLDQPSGLITFSTLTPATEYAVSFYNAADGILLADLSFTTAAPYVYTAPLISYLNATISNDILSVESLIIINDGTDFIYDLTADSSAISYTSTETTAGMLLTAEYDVSAKVGTDITVQLTAGYTMNKTSGTLTSQQSLAVPFTDLKLINVSSQVTDDKLVIVTGEYLKNDASGVSLTVSAAGFTFEQMGITKKSSNRYAFTFMSEPVDVWPGGDTDLTVKASYTIGTKRTKKATDTFHIVGFAQPSLTASYSKTTGLVTIKASGKWSEQDDMTITAVTLFDGAGGTADLTAAYTYSGKDFVVTQTEVPYTYAADANYSLAVTGTLNGEYYDYDFAAVTVSTAMTAPAVSAAAVSATGGQRGITVTLDWNDAEDSSVTNLKFFNNGTEMTIANTFTDVTNRQTTIRIDSTDFQQAQLVTGLTVSCSYTYPNNATAQTAETDAFSLDTTGNKVTGASQTADKLTFVVRLDAGAVADYTITVYQNGLLSAASATKTGTVITVERAAEFNVGDVIKVRFESIMDDGITQWSEYELTLS